MNNNFENNMNETQFEDMRQQLNTLKKKLGEQEIVNDRLIRRSMKQEANKISRRYNIIIALCILMIPYTYVVFRMNLGLSLAFWIGTSIFMLICAGATYYNSQNVTNANMMSKNLIEVGQKMARAKKFDAKLAILWHTCSHRLVGMFGVGALPARCRHSTLQSLWRCMWSHYRIYRRYQDTHQDPTTVSRYHRPDRRPDSRNPLARSHPTKGR